MRNGLKSIQAGLAGVLFLALLPGCADDGNGEGKDVQQQPDGITADVTAEVGIDQVGEDGVLEDKVQVPDLTPKDEKPQPVCDPACEYADGQYCDAATLTCKDLSCTYCLKNKDCGENGLCIVHHFAGGKSASVCSQACVADADCEAGFECEAAAGTCVPLAFCSVSPCGEGKLGDPCAFNGGVHDDCGDCAGGLTCFGIAPKASHACETEKDCLVFGHAALYNPDCVDGACGESYCVGSCDGNGECPDGGQVYKTLSGKCYCIPAGTAAAGAPCPYQTVWAEAEECGPDLYCLGIPAESDATEGQPATNECKTDDDCAFFYVGNNQCAGGYCGTSFCAARCNEEEDCEPGFYAIDAGGTCYCAPQVLGTSGLGEVCPAQGLNKDAEPCQEDMWCLPLVPTEDAAMCEEASQCAASSYPGGQICEGGFCGSTFCIMKCDENEECPPEGEPYFENEVCYCLPSAIGDSGSGEACPVGNVNLTADDCKEDFSCFGLYSSLDTPECTTAKDCPDSYFGTADCFLGHCGASSCGADCDEKGACPAGLLPFFLIGGGCYCTAPGEAPGPAKAGDPCKFFDTHSDAGNCAKGLTCFALEPSPLGDPCETAEDCPWESYAVNPECVGGFCATSFCAALCDADGLCPDGAIPQPSEEGACYCVPVQTGETELSGACPFGDVHVDADFCQPGLFCLGIVPNEEEGISCTKDEDCALEPYLANPQCVDGFCATSLCTALCDADGKCADGFEPEDIGEEGSQLCYCLPDYDGTSKTGEACPFYNVSPGADFCEPDLECLGMPAYALSESCIFAKDCPAWYLGSAACINGKCGSSQCVPKCAEGLGCETGIPWIVGEDECFCIPGLQAGTAKAGEGCPFFDVNKEAQACAAGLACYAIEPSFAGDECSKAADCAAEDYPGARQCIDGLCTSSFCAAPCSTEGKCDGAFEPTTEADLCVCAPKP
jgi:hypothetical protein